MVPFRSVRPLLIPTRSMDLSVSAASIPLYLPWAAVEFSDVANPQ